MSYFLLLHLINTPKSITEQVNVKLDKAILNGLLNNSYRISNVYFDS